MSAGEDLKSSAQVWGGNQDDLVTDSPPAYSGTIPEPAVPPELPARPRRKPVPRESYHPIRSIAKWSTVPWGQYVLPDAVVSADRTTITTTNNTYLTSQQALIKLVADQAELPPMPTLRIAGNHMEATSRVQKVDFDVTLNLSTLLDLSRSPSWRNRPAQVVPLPNASGSSPASVLVSGNNTSQIQTITRQFLKDKSDRKSFVLSRTVDGLPMDVIEGLVRNLIATLHYRGKVNVTFPLQCSQLIIQKKPGGTAAAVGGWFANVLGLSPDVKYESLERVWDIGSPRLPSVGQGSNNQADEDDLDGPRDNSVLVKEWWNAWSPAIRDAVLLRRQGKVGIEDWMEAQMGWRPKPMTQDWGIDYV